MAEELSLSFSRGMYHSPGVYFFKIIYQRWVQRFLLQIWHWLSILLTCWLISISKWGDIFSLSYAVWYRDGLIWSNWSGLKIFHIWSKGPNIKMSKLKRVGKLQFTSLWLCKMFFIFIFFNVWLLVFSIPYAQCISIILKWPQCGCPVH